MISDTIQLMTSKGLRTFTWNDPETGKDQYNEFYAIFTQSLSDKIYVLSEREVQLCMPEDPGAQPPNNQPANLFKWHDLRQKYKKDLTEIYRNHNYAINILRTLLPYPSMARSDLDNAIATRPADVAEAEWTPILQFRAALRKINQQLLILIPSERSS
jgi:hypothetical protein